MNIENIAFTAGTSHALHVDHEPRVVIDYPKSEPVLQSSYIFPKVESYGIWKFDTHAAGAVPSNF